MLVVKTAINIIESIIRPSVSKMIFGPILAILLTLARPEFVSVVPLWLNHAYEIVWFIFIIAAGWYILSCLCAMILLVLTVAQILEVKERIDANDNCDLTVLLYEALHTYESNQKNLMSIFVWHNKPTKI